jgi:hypothetical protein
MTLKQFFIKIGIKLDDAEFSKVETMIGGLKKAIVAFGAAAGAAGAALGATVMSAANDAAQIEKLAALMGVSTDTAQELGYAAQRSGVDVKDMGELMSELAENLGEAAGGTGEAADAFKSLGLNTKDTTGKVKEVDVALGEIADKFATMPDGQAKTAALMGLFGEQGIALLPILNKGSAGIAELREEARELGIVIEEDTIRQGAELTREWETFLAIAHSVKQAVAGPVIGSLLEAADAFREWWKVNQQLVKQRADKVFKALVVVVKPLLWLLQKLAVVAGFLIDNFDVLAVILGGVLLTALTATSASFAAVGYAAVVAGAKALYAWLAASAPLVGIAVLIALIILLFDDFLTYLEGGDSLIGALGEKWGKFLDEWLKPNENDPWWIKALKWSIEAVKELGRQLEKLRAPFEAFVKWYADNVATDEDKEARDMYGGARKAAQAALDGMTPGTPRRSLGGIVTGLASGNPAAAFGGGASPSSKPRPSDARPIISPTFKSEITINGAGSPEDTAKVVQETEADLWDSKMRELEAGS